MKRCPVCEMRVTDVDEHLEQFAKQGYWLHIVEYLHRKYGLDKEGLDALQIDTLLELAKRKGIKLNE